MSADPLRDHLEKIFGDSYRKEIDQEENVWRTLPFFTAALAFQLTALVAIHDWLADSGGLAWGLLALGAAFTLAAVFFLALSIWPADFRYIASEPELRDYADQVSAQQAAEAASSGEAPGDRVLALVKSVLIEQYAVSADNNRRINQRRAQWRMFAGLATLAAILAVLLLVGLVAQAHILGHAASSAPRTEPKPEPARP